MSTTDWIRELAQYQVDSNKKKEVRDKYKFRPFVEAPPSKESPENTIELDALDFATFQDGPQGLPARKKLASQMEQAVIKYGFFKVSNFGLPKEVLDEIRSISQSTLELPDDIKKQFIGGEHDLPEEADRHLGVVRGSGYKPLGHWKYDNETPDQLDLFNIRHFQHFDTFFNRIEYPEFVKYNLDSIAFYFNFLHREVLRKLATLIDIILEIPEGTTYQRLFAVEQGDPWSSSNGRARFLLYHPVSEDYNKKTNSTWLRGHTDEGALTLILSQPILSLQIRDYDTQEWKYITHTPGSLVVNIGDMLSILTGGYFKSSIHRVITPPNDQQRYNRNTVIYFSNVIPRTFLDPDTFESPKLDRLGIQRNPELPRLTARVWEDEKGEFFNGTKSSAAHVVLLGRDSVGWTDEPPVNTIKT